MERYLFPIEGFSLSRKTVLEPPVFTTCHCEIDLASAAGTKTTDTHWHPTQILTSSHLEPWTRALLNQVTLRINHGNGTIATLFSCCLLLWLPIAVYCPPIPPLAFLEAAKINHYRMLTLDLISVSFRLPLIHIWTPMTILLRLALLRVLMITRAG
jgi:hypothetical protein